MQSQSFGGEVLSALSDLGQWYLTGFTNPRKALYYGYSEFIEQQDLTSEGYMRRKLMELEKQRVIKIVKRKQKIFIRLERKGRIEWLRRQIQNQKNALPAHMKLLVLFDIPEPAASVRRSLVRELKNMGFQYEQRSAWVTRKNVGREIDQFIKYAKLDKWASVYLLQEVA